MRRLLLINGILAFAVFVLIGCAPSAGNANQNTSNIHLANSNMSNTANVDLPGINATNSNSMSGSSSLSGDDKEFLNKAAQGVVAETKLGELAQQKSQNADVKSFGQRMVEDHGNKENAELKALAAKKGITLPTDMSADKKELYDKLSKLSGAEFDKEYVKAMVDDHEKDLSEFKEEADDADDADVKAFAAKQVPVLQTHLDMIKGIQNKMK